MLAGEPTIKATLKAFETTEHLELPDRPMLAMEAAGGDRRGKQSAAMVVTTTNDFPDLNLIVDDPSEPLAELRRLLGIWTIER